MRPVARASAHTPGAKVGRLLLALVIGATLVVVAPAAEGQEPEAQAVVFDGAAAITFADVDRWAAIGARSTVGSDTQLQASLAMEFLIGARWLDGETALQGIAVSEQAVREELARRKQETFPDEAAYQAYLRDSGQTEEDFLLNLRAQLATAALRARVVAAARVPISDAQARAYFARNRRSFDRPERRDLRLVLTRSRARAVTALRELHRGRPWTSVARRHSIDRTSSRDGGRRAGVARGELERGLERVVFAARRGELRGPVRTPLGWYVVSVSRIRPAERARYAVARPAILKILRGERDEAALAAFNTDFTKRWAARTSCQPGRLDAVCRAAVAARVAPDERRR